LYLEGIGDLGFGISAPRSGQSRTL
jgi:hypothetical protein